jgi:hypothetical protein
VKSGHKARMAALYRQRRHVREAIRRDPGAGRASELRQREAATNAQLVQLQRKTNHD